MNIEDHPRHRALLELLEELAKIIGPLEWSDDCGYQLRASARLLAATCEAQACELASISEEIDRAVANATGESPLLDGPWESSIRRPFARAVAIRRLGVLLRQAHSDSES